MSDFRTRFIDDLERLDQLPSLPAVVTRLIAIVNDPLVSAMDVAYLLREDPPLTARVLRMANSPVYGGRYRIMSVPQAVMRLGMVEIRNVVTSLGVIRSIMGAGRRLDYRSFWHHSLTVALASEALDSLAPAARGAEDEGVFAAGLLHDIGRFVLDQFYPEEYDAAGRVMLGESVPLRVAEMQVIGMSHADVGALLAERWGLPEPIVAGIAHHHEPELALPTLKRNPTLVNVAERTCIANRLGDPLEGEPVAEPVQEWHDLGLDLAGVRQVVNAAVVGARKSALLLAIA